MRIRIRLARAIPETPANGMCWYVDGKPTYRVIIEQADDRGCPVWRPCDLTYDTEVAEDVNGQSRPR